MPAIKKKGDVGEEQKQASALLEEGKIQEALNVLRTGLANDSNRKNNFDRKLLLAEMCYKSNKIHIAHSILEELRGQIAHHDLETWDPESCLQVYRLTQKTSVAMAEAAEENLRPGLRSLALEAHAKISRLDPVLAFQTDPPA
jgi:thioredoxin-like negative regulator of GroEL